MRRPCRGNECVSLEERTDTCQPLRCSRPPHCTSHTYLFLRSGASQWLGTRAAWAPSLGAGISLSLGEGQAPTLSFLANGAANSVSL